MTGVLIGTESNPATLVKVLVATLEATREDTRTEDTTFLSLAGALETEISGVADQIMEMIVSGVPGLEISKSRIGMVHKTQTDGHDYYGVHNYHKPAGASYQNQNDHGPDSRAPTFGAARRNEAGFENNLNKPKNVVKTAVGGLHNNLKKPKRTHQSIDEIKNKQLKEKKDRAME